MRALLTAVQFLTRIPVPGGHAPASPAVLRAAVRWFPLVGAAVGGLTAGLAWAGAHLWPLGLSLLVAMACEAWITGAFHEDAVADFFDAFGGGFTRERTLEILKDSRIGSYGVVALFFALALRFGALLTLPPPTLFAALIAAAALGRLVILPAMALLPPVQGREGLAKDVGQQVRAWEVGLGALIAAPGVAWWAWLQPWRALAVLPVLGVLLGLFLLVVRRRLGGITGDCLGCLCYLAQLAVLLTACARWPG